MIRFEKHDDELHVLFNDSFSTIVDVNRYTLPGFYSYRIEIYIEPGYQSPSSWYSMDRMLMYALREG